MTCKQTNSVFYNGKFNCIDNYPNYLMFEHNLQDGEYGL